MLAFVIAGCAVEPDEQGDAALFDAPGKEPQSICTSSATCWDGTPLWCTGSFSCAQLDGYDGYVSCDGNVTSCPPAPNVPLIPAMTSASAPSGLVTRSGVYSSSYEGWQAFDATTQSLWLSNMYTSSVGIGYTWDGGASKTARSYEIKYNNGSCCQQRGPRDWTLQGWNGTSWVIVDTEAGQTGWYANPNRTFTVDTPGSYPRYRLLVTADNYNNASYPITLVSIASLQLYGY